jgi:nitrate/TMAO reductase-like tetraheme cytochrome c subunit
VALLVRKLWHWLTTPSARRSAGALLLAGGIGGIVFWGGFNTFLEYSNTYEFCTSCHEMSWVDEEYRTSHHFKNPSGVRAVCSDCHVPKEWTAKMKRKIQASFNELPGKILGTINTKEKFEAKRLELAENVWATMKNNDSHECRNCHSESSWQLDKQQQRARASHEDAVKTGETCIDCHKGIAHKKPKTEEEKQQEDAADFTL